MQEDCEAPLETVSIAQPSPTRLRSHPSPPCQNFGSLAHLGCMSAVRISDDVLTCCDCPVARRSTIGIIWICHGKRLSARRSP
jgi:hypothetical protein